MLVTFEVSKLETSREVRDEQLSNIWCIATTLEVSKPERSREVRDEQP